MEVVGGRWSGQVFPVRSETDFVALAACSTCTVFLHSPTVARHCAVFIPREGRFLYSLSLNVAISPS